MGVLVSESKFQVTVYESVDGVRNLSQLWKTKMKNRERKRVIRDLMEMKRTLCFIGPCANRERPDTHEVMAASPRGMAFDLDISCDGELEKPDSALLRDAKPILALLARHIPPCCRGKAEVSKDGQGITLSLGDRRVVFTSQEMKYLRENAFLYHKMAYLHEIFIQGHGKSCRVVAVLGWESAEYLPSGYGMGERDSMLGKEIRDTSWYLAIRREGLSKRAAKAATSQPAQSKLAEIVYLIHSYRSTKETREECEEACRRDKWTRCRNLQWKGGCVGWGCSWTAELRNLLRDRCSN